MPYHLAAEYGGWKNHEARFAVRFAGSCFRRYKDKVKYWMTFNEINNQANYQEDFAFPSPTPGLSIKAMIAKQSCIRLLTMS